MGALRAEGAEPDAALALQPPGPAARPLDEAMALEGAVRCVARTGGRAEALVDLRQAVADHLRIGVAEAVAASLFLAALGGEDHGHGEAGWHPCFAVLDGR